MVLATEPAPANLIPFAKAGTVFAGEAVAGEGVIAPLNSGRYSPETCASPRLFEYRLYLSSADRTVEGRVVPLVLVGVGH